VKLLPGSFSNRTYLIEAHLPDGGTLQCFVRRYQIFGKSDCGEKAWRELKAFELIHEHGIPGIVTHFVPGTLRLDAPAEPLPWARSLTAMLKKIYAIRLDKACRGFLELM
jgi:hypothetical protein